MEKKLLKETDRAFIRDDNEDGIHSANSYELALLLYMQILHNCLIRKQTKNDRIVCDFRRRSFTQKHFRNPVDIR